MSALPPGSRRCEGLAEAPAGGGGGVPLLPCTPRPHHEALVLGDGQEGGLRAPELAWGASLMERTQPLLAEPSLCWRGHSRDLPNL